MDLKAVQNFWLVFVVCPDAVLAPDGVYFGAFVLEASVACNAGNFVNFQYFMDGDFGEVHQFFFVNAGRAANITFKVSECIELVVH